MTQIYLKPITLVTRPEEPQRIPQTRSILHPRRSGPGLVTTSQSPSGRPMNRPAGRGEGGRRMQALQRWDAGSSGRPRALWAVPPSRA